MRRLGCVIVLVSFSQVAHGQDPAKPPELMPLPELGIPDLRTAPPNEMRSVPVVESGSVTSSPVPGATGSTGVTGAVHVPAALASFPSLPAATPPPATPPQLSALPVGPPAASSPGSAPLGSPPPLPPPLTPALLAAPTVTPCKGTKCTLPGCQDNCCQDKCCQDKCCQDKCDGEAPVCPLCCAMDCLGLDKLIPPRVTVRADFGDGVGYTRGYTYLEGFIPLVQPTETSVLFSDLRVVNFDDASRWEFNAGGGYRTYLDFLDVVLGVNAFYDGRHTDTNFFNQIGVGVELLFNWWEFRANGYFVVGDNRQLATDSGPVIGSVVGDQVIID